MADEGDKMKLFDSGEEEEEEEGYDDFKIRPQYEGPHGQQILEINSQLSKRFKLDERFAEDLESENLNVGNASEENEEKQKNMRILETILGHEVTTKSVDKSFQRKRLIRFDPEDENASKFVRTQENSSEKSKKAKKKKEIVEKNIEDIIPVSADRYVEVSSNLKEILKTSTPFSFSQKFNFDNAEEVITDSENETSPKFIEEVKHHDSKIRTEKKLVTQSEVPRIDHITPKSNCDAFFIVDDDPRLKEGIEFFKRPKPLEEIRVEWQKKRENVLALFRQKKRTGQRSCVTRVQNVQKKNMIRKHNFKK